MLIKKTWTCDWGKLAGARYGNKLECTSRKHRRSKRTEKNEPAPVPDRDGFVVVMVIVIVLVYITHSK